MKAKLFFNPAAGDPAAAGLKLIEILRHLQAAQIEPEVLLIEPTHDLQALARTAAHAGAKLLIVAGGDGTVERAAHGLLGTPTTLGIIPAGTRNNMARSLGIPLNDIPAATALLQAGLRRTIDVGRVRYRKRALCFFESSFFGLASAMYPASDDLQHGDLGKLGEFIATFMAAVPSEIRLRLDHQREEVVANGHLVLIANMPYMGPSFQPAPDIAFDDRQLDVFVYSDLNKLDLIGHAIQSPAAPLDARIQRFRAHTITLTTNPPMPVVADGVPLETGAGSVTVTLHPHRLRVMTPHPSPVTPPQPYDPLNALAEAILSPDAIQATQ